MREQSFSREDFSSPPTRLFVDMAFWGAHLSALAAIVVYPSLGKGPSFMLLALGLTAVLLLIAYYFAIGIYASRTGRSAVVWGGLSFLLAPFGVWISYIASFFIGKAPRSKKLQ